MSNIGTTRSQKELWIDSLLHAHTPKTVRYHGKIIAGGFPVGTEVFINGEQDNRFYIPNNSAIVGTFLGVAWTTTINEPKLAQIFFSIENDDNTVAASPLTFGGAGPNPNVLFESPVGVNGWSLNFDNTLKALTVNYLSFVGETSKLTGRIDFVVAGELSSFSNTLTVVDNS